MWYPSNEVPLGCISNTWSPAEGCAFLLSGDHSLLSPSVLSPSPPPLSSLALSSKCVWRHTLFPPPAAPSSHLLTTAYNPPCIICPILDPQPMPFATGEPPFRSGSIAHS